MFFISCFGLFRTKNSPLVGFGYKTIPKLKLNEVVSNK